MLSILKSALNANSKELGIVSNNIANVNSTAFKKSKTNFEHIYSRDRSTSPSRFSGHQRFSTHAGLCGAPALWAAK